MSLSAGDKLGPYEILAPIGSGGMGEVYKARDTRLDRLVAIKVSKTEFSERFEREAKAIAALNHPHICQLYDVGPNYLVMEYVDGIPLKGPLPLEKALEYAVQIASALDAAHTNSITHRDLKPGNVLATKQGVKLLDFGLAKIEKPVAVDQETMTMGLTMKGQILGTLLYMSPEQVNGQEADARSDIFSFGLLLYEMLTGKRAFEGSTPASVMGAILERPAPSIAEIAPVALDRVLKRCLEKDPENRWQSARDLKAALAWITAAPEAERIAQVPPRKAPSRFERVPWIVASALAIVAAVAGSIVVWTLKSSSSAAVTRFSLVLPTDQVFTRSERHLIAISPDSSKLVYVVNNQLFLRQMAEGQARPIQGTSGGAANPFFSPDGQWVGFWSISDSALKKIMVTGGEAVTICKAEAPLGATWDGDWIVFGESGTGIRRVSANGGQPETLVSIKSEEGVGDSPQLLDGGRVVLFTLAAPGGTEGLERWDRAEIVAQRLPSGERTVIVSGGSDGRYLPSGHILYALRGNMLAVPFDVKKLRLTGGHVFVVEGVWRATDGQTGAAHLSVSRNGTLAYIPGSPSGSAVRTTLALVDRAGKVQALSLPAAQYVHPRVSPDGKQLVVMMDDGTDVSVGVFEMAGNTGLRRLTFGGKNRFPIWSHDGRYVIFSSDREGANGLFRQRADGIGPIERLTKAEPGTIHTAQSADPSGKALAFSVNRRGGGGIWVLPLDGSDRQPRPFAEVPNSIQTTAAFSRDGRWLAYMSTELKRPQLFLQSYPNPGTKYQITTEGGGMPVWSPDSKQLVYLGGPNQYVALDIRTEPTFSSGKPVPLPLEKIVQPLPGQRNYDIAPDGKLLVVMPDFSQSESSPSSTLQINVVLNWFEELKHRLPVQ